LRIEYIATSEGEFSDLQTFRAEHADAQILTVDGRECLGMCNVCSHPVLDGDRFYQLVNGALACSGCGV
jgi:hypothetical protein